MFHIQLKEASKKKIRSYLRIFRKLFIYSFSVLGWGIIFYILVETFLNGGTRVFSMNTFNEMWIEIIVVPIILINLIVSVFIEAREI